MPVISGKSSLAAGQTLDNVLAGSQFEFLPYDAALEFGITCDDPDITADVYSGQDVLLENGTVPDKSASNQVTAVYPDDFPLTDVAAAGERIKIRYRNNGLASATVYWNVRITPF